MPPRKTTKKTVSKKKAKIAKKKIQKKPVQKQMYDINVDQILLNHRHIYLTGQIDSLTATDINKQLLALNLIDKNDSIILWIDSPGGSISAGFSIVDTILAIEADVITVINGCAYSMAGIISLYGCRRYMTSNSTWMTHDMRTGGHMTGSEFLSYAERVDYLQKKLRKILMDRTKLTNNDIKKAFETSLFLNYDECLSKGIVESCHKE